MVGAVIINSLCDVVLIIFIFIRKNQVEQICFIFVFDNLIYFHDILGLGKPFWIWIICKKK
jgi:hypothetical protein